MGVFRGTRIIGSGGTGGGGTTGATAAQATQIAANTTDVAALEVSQAAQDTMIAAAATKAELAAVQALVAANTDRAVVKVERQPDMSLLVTFDDTTTETVAAATSSVEIDEVAVDGTPLGTTGTLQIVRDAGGSGLQLTTSTGERVAV